MKETFQSFFRNFVKKREKFEKPLEEMEKNQLKHLLQISYFAKGQATLRGNPIKVAIF